MTVFRPPRRAGMIFHLALVAFFVSMSLFGLGQTAYAEIGMRLEDGIRLLVALLPAFLSVGVVPFLIYRIYALQTATYTLNRDGIRLRWGLRSLDIPLGSVQWVQFASQVQPQPPLPWLRWPGALLGVRSFPQGKGEPPVPIEFMAANVRNLVLIATTGRVYAISPAEPDALLRSFQQYLEMGSLSPVPARSVQPTYLLGRLWEDRTARLLILSGLIFGLVLLIGAVLAISTRSQVHLGFHPDGTPGDLAPAVRLLLIPLLNGFQWIAAFTVGLVFFRREPNKLMAYLLWGSGALSAMLFGIGLVFILRSGGG